MSDTPGVVAVTGWREHLAAARRQLVSSQAPDSIDAAIGYALNDCEERIDEALKAAEAGTERPAFYDGERFVPFEENPERHVYTTGAIKDNKSKPRVDLLPSLPLVEIAKVLTYGARKYKPNNWRFGLPWGDTYASMQRHLLAWQNREDKDPETGISHLAHAGCQLMFLLEYELTKTGTDDRWTPVNEEG